MMKAAKANKKAHKKTEADKKSSTSSISDGDADHKAASREVKIKGVKHQNRISQDNVKAKSKSTVNSSKPSGSFMKPTASHLAKKNKECDMHSGGCGRLQKPLASLDDKLRSPIICQSQATKRQKLDIGYLRKVAQLKHRASYLHKVTKKAAHLEGILNSKVKTTIPQKPALVTEERAIRRRSQNKPVSVQQPKANTNAYGAQPLNKKVGTCYQLASFLNRNFTCILYFLKSYVWQIRDAPKFLAHKKSMTHLTGLQDFRMQTSDCAMQVQSANVLHKQNSAPLMTQDIRKRGAFVLHRTSCNMLTLTAVDSNRVSNFQSLMLYPISYFESVMHCSQNSGNAGKKDICRSLNKLSLKSESETKNISSLRQPRPIKGLKENVPQSFQQDFRRCAGKPNHGGTDRRYPQLISRMPLEISKHLACKFKIGAEGHRFSILVFSVEMMQVVGCGLFILWFVGWQRKVVATRVWGSGAHFSKTLFENRWKKLNSFVFLLPYQYTTSPQYNRSGFGLFSIYYLAGLTLLFYSFQELTIIKVCCLRFHSIM
ncbi:TPX2 [Artemisia annua]|uniref:TPX2 n=1 Tax=Artemisia annua TaxID=35608 RepID=A0A2U1PCK9_ARTAN|nr:TPX2 [Artemisia annua]